MAEVRVNPCNFADLLRPAAGTVADLVSLVSKTLPHFDVELASIDELNHSFSLRFFAIAENPKVSGDPRVVEKLFRQGHNRFQPIVGNDPFADLRFTTTGVAREKRRTIKDYADTAPALVRGSHL